MTDSLIEQWQKEQRVLVDLIAAHPSAELTQERDRLVLLNQLLAERASQQDA